MTYMRQYEFIQRCHPQNDLRVGDILEFLKLMRKAFGILHWEGEDGKVVLTSKWIEAVLQEFLSARPVPDAGVTWVIASSDKTGTILVSILTGTKDRGHDYYDVDFSRSNKLPALS